MQKDFRFKLTGGAWFGLFAIMYVVFTSLIGTVAMISIKYINVKPNTYSTAFWIDMLLCMLAVLVCILVMLSITIPLYRKFIGATEFDGKPFRFYGNIPGFVWFNVWQIFLSFITLFIYMPWYMNKLYRYLVTNTEYDGKKPEWNGKGSDLFLIMLWAFYVPFILLIIYSGVFHPETSKGIGNYFYNFLSQILFLPLGYKLYEWFFNHTAYETKASHWNTSFWPSVGMMAGQTALTFITCFIYWPAAVLRIYRYFAPKTEILENGKLIGRFSTTYSIGQGFLLIWGQTLLSIITLGIYVPWAVARVGRFMAENTKYQAA